MQESSSAKKHDVSQKILLLTTRFLCEPCAIGFKIFLLMELANSRANYDTRSTLLRMKLVSSEPLNIFWDKRARS